MGRVIQTDKVGTERTRLLKSIVLALRVLLRNGQPNPEAQDQAAYIALALYAVQETIETSVAAWEKRDYWIKADRFRMEWSWTGALGRRMHAALLADDWSAIAALAVEVTGKLQNIHVGEKHRLGTPWNGAWKTLCQRQLAPG